MGYWGLRVPTVTLSGSLPTSPTTAADFSYADTRLTSAVDLTIPANWTFHCSRFGSLRPLENSTFALDIKGFQV